MQKNKFFINQNGQYKTHLYEQLKIKPTNIAAIADCSI